MGVLGLSRTQAGRRVANLLYKRSRFYADARRVETIETEALREAEWFAVSDRLVGVILVLRAVALPALARRAKVPAAQLAAPCWAIPLPQAACFNLHHS